MHVSIWQQFSSNHSARFTVVGVFSDSAAAQRAATELTTLMREITAWYSRPENEEALMEREDDLAPPSPPEQAFAAKHGIVWVERSLDWAWADEAGNSPVQVVEHLVFVDGTESWLGAYPANAMVAQFGAEVLVDGTVDEQTLREVYLHLTCDMPDASTAQTICDAVAAYQVKLQQRQDIFAVPWQGSVFESSTFEGVVRMEGTRLVVENGTFFHIADGFPAMLRYLRKHGATNIKYRFEERAYSYREDGEDEE